ncbi:MAG: SulP family inorganic anion transporter [Nitrospinota bacterium]|nr:SulP family inorganic anion transporter [Nitrospinota bacterium]
MSNTGPYSNIKRDLVAGATVAVVALPLAMAFAIASGLPPERGLYTAIVAGFLISMLGGSRFQIGGPTGAFVVVVYGVVSRHGVDGLVIATIMAGGMLVLLGLARFGDAIKFIPYPVTTGFTAGIALIIASSQVNSFFGLGAQNVPADFTSQWAIYLSQSHGVSWPTALFSLASVGLLVILRRLAPRFPGPLAIVTLGAAVVWWFQAPLATIGSVYGAVPHSLPAPSFPDISLERIRELMSDAITIALLGAIESLMSAVVADGMTGDRHKPNRELIGQGVANIAAAIFGGMPATGAIARTATNIRSGAASSLAGMSHAVFLLIFMFFLAEHITHIPLASLAAILMVVAWNMSEPGKVRSIFRAPGSDTLAMLTTFFLTVLVNLNVAVQVGVALAGLLFIKRMTEVTRIGAVDGNMQALLAGETQTIFDPDAIKNKTVPEGVEVYEIEGPFFFGVADRLQTILPKIESPPVVLILRMRHVPMIDATGLNALESLMRNCRRHSTTMLLSGVRGDLRQALARYGFIDKIGEENVLSHIDKALKRAEQILADR